MNKLTIEANADLLKTVAAVLKDGKSSINDACQLLNTVARFEERTEAESEKVSEPRQ